MAGTPSLSMQTLQAWSSPGARLPNSGANRFKTVSDLRRTSLGDGVLLCGGTAGTGLYNLPLSVLTATLAGWSPSTEACSSGA